MTRAKVLSATTLLALAAATAVANNAAGRAGNGPVVAHHASGYAAPAKLHPRVQVIKTAFTGGEPTVGFDKSGAAWFPGWELDPAGALLMTTLHSVRPDGTGVRDRTPRVAGESTEQTEDPYLYSDPRSGRVFDVEYQLPCSLVRFTDDGGQTWTTSVAGCSLADHQTVFAGPAPEGGTQPLNYPSVVYYCAITDGALSDTSAGIGCERSLDGGLTWVNTGGQAYTLDSSCAATVWIYVAGCDGVGGNGVVAPDGTVLLPKVFNGIPMLARSGDEGLTWQRVVVDPHRASTDFNGYSDGQSSVAVDRTGVVYYAWMGRDRQPKLAVSRDGGRSFGKPQSVGIPGLHQAWHVAVDAVGRGKVAIHYIGSVDAPSAPFPDDSTCRDYSDRAKDLVLGTTCTYTPAKGYRWATWNAYLAITTDALATNPTWYSVRANPATDPLIVGECLSLRCQQMYDFTDVHISPHDGSAWAVYLDACNTEGRCADFGSLQLVRLSGVDLRR